MRLLVSVRSAAEVAPALAGGADIIDAKDPAQGSLGAVSSAALVKIAQAVPPGVSLSVALGDLHDPVAAERAVAGACRATGQRSELYLKLGLAGTPNLADAAMIATAAVAAAGRRSAHVVLVAYADPEWAASPGPEQVIAIARRAGADGLLLDTFRKEGLSLTHCLADAELASWVDRARGTVGLVALAGSLDLDELRRVGRLPAGVVGVRGAACTGGRMGAVSETKVRALKAALLSQAPAGLTRIARSGG